MRRSHRFTGLLAAVSLVASVLFPSGFACERPGGDDHMASMAMASTSVQGSSVTSGTSPGGETPAPSPEPCRLPWAPSGCQSMVPCAPAAVATEHVAVSDIAPEFHVASAVVLTPPSETKLPELPPPRA